MNCQVKALKRSRPNLSAERIVAAAIELADDEGADALSMRRVAMKLGAGTMSLYSYVANKDELIDLVADELFRHVSVAEPSGDWRTDISEIAHASRAMFLDHPWILNALGTRRPSFSPGLARHIEDSFGAFDGLGLDLETITVIVTTVDNFVMGSVLDELREQEIRRSGGTSQAEELGFTRAGIERLLDGGGDYPHLVSLLDLLEQGVVDADGMFDRGLECVLDGVAVTIERQSTKAGHGRSKPRRASKP